MAETILALVNEQCCEEMRQMVLEAPPGCVVELGVYQGGSARYLYDACEQQNRELYLYDTFEGIPFRGGFDSHKVGDFSDTNAEMVSKMLPRAKVIKGTFPFSIMKMPPIAFAHVDADQYDSIRMAIYVLGPMMVPGGVMWFDDVGCLDSANKAVKEWALENNRPLYKSKTNKCYARF